MLESISAETLHSSVGLGQHASQRIAYRHATAADIAIYYGSPQRQTVRALVATKDDEPFFIVGLANEDGYLKAFSEYKPGCKPLLKSMAVLRALKKVSQWAEESRLPVVAVAQPDEAESPSLLKKFGFEFHSTAQDGDIYEWLG